MTDELKFGLFKRPVYEREDERGLFFEFVNTGNWQSAIYCQMKAGAVMGGHRHRYTVELIYILEGKARIDVVDIDTGATKEYVLQEHQGYVFKAQERKTINYLEKSKIIVLKSHRYDPHNPDIVEDE